MPAPIFYDFSDGYVYGHTPILPTDTDLYLPLEVDTEFYQKPCDFTGISNQLNTTITIQYRAISLAQGIIYSHTDISGMNPRHTTASPLFSAVGYLNDLGYRVKLARQTDINNDQYPTLTFDLYTFFAVAELYRIFDGDFLQDIDYLCVSKDKQGIEQSRRVRTFNKQGRFYADYVLLPWTCTIDNYIYRVALRIFDTSAIHGVANYASFCSNSGLQLFYKNVFSKEDMGEMLNMYFLRPNDFDNYALGDLYNHQALCGNAENFKIIYKNLDLSLYYTYPRLTIGSTVNKLFEACILKLFKSSPNDRSAINNFCFYSSAEYLRNLVGTTAPLNAKVDGGRCRNNRPLDSNLDGVLCDIDISSCYGDGLRSQSYPFGRPLIIDYPSDSDRNDYLTLREFLKMYSHELVPGLWQARVSIKLGVTLNYAQDLLVSWIPPKDIRKMPTDTEFAMTDEWWTIDNVGECKIFKNEIRYSIITHDFLQWLDNIATSRQKKELLDNLEIITAAFYPNSEKVDSIEELLTAHLSHRGTNTTGVYREKSSIKKVSINRECHKWFSVNLGEFLVSSLITERKKYSKEEGLNQLYKLCTNTVYGDMVSPYFKVGNVVVGNNITARARTLCWYMEKGLYGVQSITDGCLFDLNRVSVPKTEKYRVTGENTVDFYSNINNSNINLKPLQIKSLKILKWQLIYLNGESCLIAYCENGKKKFYSHQRSFKIINRYAFEHLQNLFPNVDVLFKSNNDVYGKNRIGLYEFEVKDFFTRCTFHGTANYSLIQYDDSKSNKYAMRSYQRQFHNKVISKNGLIEIASTDYYPSKQFLDALQTPASVPRSNVFVRRKILKLGDYKRNFTKWKETRNFPGMTIETPSLIREFSLAQFTYQNYLQYDSWRKEYQKLMKKYGQSYEQYFLNIDGSLNYSQMCKVLDEKIRLGLNSFFEGTDKRKSNTYRLQTSHCELDTLNRATEILSTSYALVNSDDFEIETFYGDSDE